MEYTNEFLARVYGAYIGSECIAGFGGYQHKIIGIELLNGRVMIQNTLKGKEQETDWWLMQEYECYPIVLTPLSSITDEHALGVAKIILPLPFQRRTKGWKVSRDFAISGWPYIKVHHPLNQYSLNIDCKGLDFNVYKMEDCETPCHPMVCYSVIDYLRSKGYDCGYGEIPSLIESGIAIKKQQP